MDSASATYSGSSPDNVGRENAGSVTVSFSFIRKLLLQREARRSFAASERCAYVCGCVWVWGGVNVRVGGRKLSTVSAPSLFLFVAYYYYYYYYYYYHFHFLFY